MVTNHHSRADTERTYFESMPQKPRAMPRSHGQEAEYECQLNRALLGSFAFLQGYGSNPRAWHIIDKHATTWLHFPAIKQEANLPVCTFVLCGVSVGWMGCPQLARVIFAFFQLECFSLPETHLHSTLRNTPPQHTQKYPSRPPGGCIFLRSMAGTCEFPAKTQKRVLIFSRCL